MICTGRWVIIFPCYFVHSDDVFGSAHYCHRLGQAHQALWDETLRLRGNAVSQGRPAQPTPTADSLFGITKQPRPARGRSGGRERTHEEPEPDWNRENRGRHGTRSQPAPHCRFRGVTPPQPHASQGETRACRKCGMPLGYHFFEYGMGWCPLCGKKVKDSDKPMGESSGPPTQQQQAHHQDGEHPEYHPPAQGQTQDEPDEPAEPVEPGPS